MESTEARIDRGKVKDSFNSPHKIDCSNGKMYVVKPRRSDKQFSNEVLGIALAEIIGVPHQEAAFVSVDEAFRQASPMAANKYSVGVHFASLYEPKSWTFDNPAPGIARQEIANINDLYKVVTFDEVVVNTDRRGNSGNNMVVQISNATPRYRYVAIDHGHILTGDAWDLDSLRNFNLEPIVPVFTFVETCLTSFAEMENTAQHVANLAQQFNAVVMQATTDLTEDEKAAVADFVVGRAGQLPVWVNGQQYRAALQNLQA